MTSGTIIEDTADVDGVPQGTKSNALPESKNGGAENLFYVCVRVLWWIIERVRV